MNIKEFIEVIEKLPADCEIITGNATSHWNDEKSKDIFSLNFYEDFSKEELEKDFSKIKQLIIWGDE